MFVTATSAGFIPLLLPSVLVAPAVTIVYATVPSTAKSSTPVTVTVCAAFQLAGVNVTEAGATVPSVRSLDESPIVTFAVGWVRSTTVNVAVPPDSVVVRPEVGATAIPAVSLSVFVTATSAACIPLYLPSVLVAAALTSEHATVPSTAKSSTPVTVTVCAVFQFPGVNVREAGATVPSVRSLDEFPIVTFAVG